MDHRQFEVRARIVDRNAPLLDDEDFGQQVTQQQQDDRETHFDGRRSREDRREGGMSRHERQRGCGEQQRGFDQRAVERFAAGTHALERAARVHGRQDERRAAQCEQVDEADQIARERDDGRQVAYRDEEQRRDGRREVEGRCRAEERRGRGRVDGPLAQQQGRIVEVLREARAAAARQPCARAVDDARDRQGDGDEQQDIQQRRHQSRLRMEHRNTSTMKSSAKRM